MTYRQRLGFATALLTTLVPFAAMAANPDSWNGSTSNAWETGSNWSAGAPTTTSAVTISNLNNNPVQLNSNVSLNATSGTNVGSLTIGTGAAPGTANVLNINAGDTLTMGTHAVTLDGGSITGPGTLSSTGTISGYGTISSQIVGTTFSATATDGTAFGGFSPFVNGTPGTAITLIGQQNLTNDTFNVSNHGNFNFQGVTITAPSLGGVSTNLNAGSSGGNNYYGLFNFTGAASTLAGNISNGNYETLNVTGTTLHLNNVTWSNNWGSSAPAAFVVGAGGTLDNIGNGSASVTNGMQTILQGGAITNSGGGNLNIGGQINGYGSVTGVSIASGGVVAKGGTLVVNGGAGMSVVSAGWGTGGGANDVLDLKGTFNFAAAGGFPSAPGIYPSNGTVQLDGATINANGSNGPANGSLYTSSGNVVAASGVNTLNGNFLPSGSNGTVANYTVNTGATLSLQNTSTLVPTAIVGHNFTMQNGSFLSVGATTSAISLSGNFSFQQTDAVNAWTYGGTQGLGPDLIMTGGTSSNPTTVEAGGINMGYVAAGFVDNFALHSLTIGSGGHVSVVDQFANATQSGWTSGTEALYIDALIDPPGGTLNLDGMYAYLLGYGQLQNGVVDGVTIIGAPVATPEPATLAMLGVGLFGIGMIRRRRQGIAAD